ncbi:MAG: hypothetical protein ACHQ4H_09215 [Ktedonobacterales bacterium]
MDFRQLRLLRVTGALLNLTGTLLLIAGAVAGWGLPALSRQFGLFAAAHTTLTSVKLDSSSYLGADITALAVLIAVVVGANGTTLQIASQFYSLGRVRELLFSLMPFLACCCVTMAIALIYFLVPPVYVVQLWQLLLWFAAVVLYMVGYLWVLPLRISIEEIVYRVMQALRRTPIANWESLESFDVLQSQLSSVVARGEVGTARALTRVLGHFFTVALDLRAETENSYNRLRYRAVKSLLTTAMQNVPGAPNAVAYYLGSIQAGVLVQAAAIGLPFDDPTHDLFSGVYRALQAAPARIDPVWTGTRHALCRGSAGDEPLLIEFWLARTRWSVDDPRRVTRIAAGLAAFHRGAWRQLRDAATEDADALAGEMLSDLYRDIATQLAPRLAHGRRQYGGGVRPEDLALGLLDSVHAAALAQWPDDAALDVRLDVLNAYEQRRTGVRAAFASKS